MTPEEELARLAAEAASASTPGAALRRLGALRRALDEFERRQVARVLSEGGSFASIGRDLGLSRQAVHRRYRDLSPAPVELEVLQPSADVRQAIRFAREEAAALGAVELGDEHVLLGLLRMAPPRQLEQAGVTLAKVRHHVEAITPRSPFFGRDVPAADLRGVLAGPAREALRRGSRTITADDLLLGMLREPGSGAVRTLRALGAEPDAIRARLEGVAQPSSP